MPPDCAWLNLPCDLHHDVMICVRHSSVPCGPQEVETLFHEFGHALQHMLTTVEEGLVSGIRGVEWDAVRPALLLLNTFPQSLMHRPHPGGPPLPSAVNRMRAPAGHFAALAAWYDVRAKGREVRASLWGRQVWRRR
jgi:oligopeptidase A